MKFQQISVICHRPVTGKDLKTSVDGHHRAKYVLSCIVSCLSFTPLTGLLLIFLTGRDLQKVAGESGYYHMVDMLFSYESSRGSNAVFPG